VLRIRNRIRMDPHDFGLLDPHHESAFQMRMRIRINYLKISVENLFTNTIIYVENGTKISLDWPFKNF
jgi:hypothetical protein